MILIKTVLFTFFPTKKRLKAKDNKDFEFILLASKNVKIIWKEHKSLKNIMNFS